jgi:hypothetical protein
MKIRIVRPGRIGEPAIARGLVVALRFPDPGVEDCRRYPGKIRRQPDRGRHDVGGIIGSATEDRLECIPDAGGVRTDHIPLGRDDLCCVLTDFK